MIRFIAMLTVVAANCAAQTCEVSWSFPSYTGPSLRYGHAMAYDGARHQTVMFGGSVSPDGALNGDTWTWNGSVWTQRANTGPSPRSGSAMCYDSLRQRIVLHGGGSRETWEWDGSAWSLSTPVGAPNVSACPMAFDAARGVSVLIDDYGRTLAWDGTAWTYLAAASAGPGPRTETAMVYDSARQRVVLFGGSGGGALGDTWEWDGAQWALRSTFGPPARWGHMMAYDPATARSFLYGGVGVQPYADLWGWDGVAWSQHQPPPNYNPPYGAEGAAAYDTSRSRLVLFGGHYSNSYVSGTFELLGAGPPTVGSQPLPVAILPGQRAMFAVGAAGPAAGGAVAYQWRHDGFALTDGLRVLGSHSSVLIVDNVTGTDLGAYDVVISNACAQVVSAPASLSFQCYANCDNSQIAPVLNVADFTCFLQRYAAGCQ